MALFVASWPAHNRLVFAEHLLGMVHYGHHHPSTKRIEDDHGEPVHSPPALAPALRMFDAPGMFVGNELAQVGECLLDWPPSPSRRF